MVRELLVRDEEFGAFTRWLNERFEVEMAAANVLAAWRVIIASDAGCEDTRDTFSEVSRVVLWLLF